MKAAAGQDVGSRAKDIGERFLQSKQLDEAKAGRVLIDEDVDVARRAGIVTGRGPEQKQVPHANAAYAVSLRG